MKVLRLTQPLASVAVLGGAAYLAVPEGFEAEPGELIAVASNLRVDGEHCRLMHDCGLSENEMDALPQGFLLGLVKTDKTPFSVTAAVWNRRNLGACLHPNTRRCVAIKAVLALSPPIPLGDAIPEHVEEFLRQNIPRKRRRVKDDSPGLFDREDVGAISL